MCVCLCVCPNFSFQKLIKIIRQEGKFLSLSLTTSLLSSLLPLFPSLEGRGKEEVKGLGEMLPFLGRRYGEGGAVAGI